MTRCDIDKGGQVAGATVTTVGIDRLQLQMAAGLYQQRMEQGDGAATGLPWQVVAAGQG